LVKHMLHWYAALLCDEFILACIYRGECHVFGQCKQGSTIHCFYCIHHSFNVWSQIVKNLVEGTIWMIDNLLMIETCHRHVLVWQNNLHPYHCRHELLHNLSSVIDSIITVITLWNQTTFNITSK
jgi:hypothetical protein